MKEEPIFIVSGVVMRGERKGSALGFPTANVPCPSATAAQSGIYAGKVEWKGKSYPAAIYKGEDKNIVEAHIIDLPDARDLYGETIKIVAQKRVRDEKKFSDQGELIAAIAEDVKTIKKLCSQE